MLSWTALGTRLIHESCGFWPEKGDLRRDIVTAIITEIGREWNWWNNCGQCEKNRTNVWTNIVILIISHQYHPNSNNGNVLQKTFDELLLIAVTQLRNWKSDKYIDLHLKCHNCYYVYYTFLQVIYVIKKWMSTIEKQNRNVEHSTGGVHIY